MDKAPRSGESHPSLKATGLAKGTLPLAVWLDGDRSHGQGRNPNQARRQGRNWAGLQRSANTPHQARQGQPAQAFTVWQGKPIAVSTTGKAPRSGDSLPTVKATGLARGILPLAVWLDGDRSHGQGRNLDQARRQGRNWLGFNDLPTHRTKQGTGNRRKPSRSGRASRLPLAPRARLHYLAIAFNRQGHGTSERNPALGRSGWRVIEATGKPEPRSTRTARQELGRA